MSRAVYRPSSLLAGLMVALFASTSHAAVWRVVYDLEGVQLDIRNTPLGLGNGSYVIGPGYIVIDYPASGGALVDGAVQMRRFSLVQDFTTATSSARVDADLFSESNFSGVQTLATGTLAAGVITWTQSFPYKLTGTNTCTGNFCGLAGFEEGVPTDEAREDPVTFAPFTFGSGGPQAGAGFDGDEVLLPGNAAADTFLLLQGREIRRTLLEPGAPDSCLNFPSYGAHTADRDCDGSFRLSELLRVVQLFNALQYHCELGTEDSYEVGPGNTGACVRHAADFDETPFRLSLSELLRAVQLFNVGSFAPCATQKDGDEGFCAAT